MSILVTGGAGQLGAELVARLAADGAAITVFDVAAPPASLPRGVTWRRGDVVQLDEVLGAFEAARPRRVYHLAAVLSATGERDPQRAYAINMTGTYNVLEACRRLGTRQLLFASTIAVFGPGLPEPVPDEVSLRPTTMYGVTKVAGELLGEYYHRRYGLDFRAVRFPGLVNAGVPGGGTTDYALHMYVDAIRFGRYECFVGPHSIVPLMYMPDALRAFAELAEAPDARLRRRVYNIAAISPTAAEIAAAVERRVAGAKITFKPDPIRQAILDSWPRRIDDACAREDWGWRPRYDLETMSDDLVAKLRASTPAG
jgi:threonine 3-dehydrogenase